MQTIMLEKVTPGPERVKIANETGTNGCGEVFHPVMKAEETAESLRVFRNDRDGTREDTHFPQTFNSGN